jgi:hypothetical protein
MFLSLGRYLCCWTINPRRFHSPISQCFYHWVDTSADGPLVPECIILPAVNVSITGFDFSAGALLVPEGIILQAVNVYITGSIPLLADY